MAARVEHRVGSRGPRETGVVLLVSSPVLVEEADGITTVVLNDIKSRNALCWDLVRALAEAVETASTGGTRALILRSAAPVFCAGGSVDELLQPKVPLEEIYRAFRALDQAPMPTVAAVDGAVVGAGLNLVLCCDLAICTPESQFDARFLDVGIHPGGGALWRLAGALGPHAAAAVSLFGEVLDGEEAARRGLVWRCVPTEELIVESVRLARKVASRDPELVSKTKQTLRTVAAVDDPTNAIGLELEAQRWSMERPAFQASLGDLRAWLGRPAS